MTETSPDRPFAGILLMLGFCMLIPLSDAMAKILGETVALPVILLARFVLQAAILVAVLGLMGGSLRVPPGLRLWVLLRTVLFIVGMGLMFAALRVLPLADAVAIAFVMPFVLLLLGHLTLGEEVGAVRLGACAVGFVGTLLVIQPNFVEVGVAALLPLGVAVVFAVFMLVTRRVTRGIGPVALQAITGLQGAAILLPLVLLTLPSEALAGPLGDGPTLGRMLAMGVFGSVAHLAMTWSLRLAPASTLAPMQYLEIPFATLVGLLVFGDLPDGLALIGICVTIAAGLFVVFRERAIAARPLPAP